MFWCQGALEVRTASFYNVPFADCRIYVITTESKVSRGRRLLRTLCALPIVSRETIGFMTGRAFRTCI